LGGCGARWVGWSGRSTVGLIILQENDLCWATKLGYIIDTKERYTESVGLSTSIEEIYRVRRAIYLNQGIMRTVSGDPPKSGSYSESFRRLIVILPR
jgi:hypothetical protein